LNGSIFTTSEGSNTSILALCQKIRKYQVGRHPVVCC